LTASPVLESTTPKGNLVLLRSYLFHLKARNLSPRTVKAAGDYLRQFLAIHDPLHTTKRDIEGFLADKTETCRPSTVQTHWRYLSGFFAWLFSEGDIGSNPMASIPKPIVPPIDIPLLSSDQVRQLLDTCRGKSIEERRDFALLTIMLDTGLRLAEISNLTIDDVGDDFTLRVFGKGRKWRTVALGDIASQALDRWLRVRPSTTERLWTGLKGDLTPNGVRQVVRRRGRTAGLRLHPHMLRHTFVDNWLRNGGSEVDLARLAGWSSTSMANRYAQHRAAERALVAHKKVAPLDGLT
jgi:integrase/recombinase XerC